MNGTKNLPEILFASKNAPGIVLNTLLLILGSLIMIHGVIGIFYAITTNYNILKLLKEKAFFYLQIISAIGATFVIMNLFMPSGNTRMHTVLFWLTSFVIALLGSFHIANGFFNACITLGISVSQQSKLIIKIISWIIAVISLLQIILLML